MSLFICILLAIPAVYAQSSIFRPCQLGDYRCIGGYLAANSRCNPQVAGSIPTSYVLSSFPFETPVYNTSNIDNNLNITNHNNCGVAEFFYNSVTNGWVLGLRCLGLRFQSVRTLIQHYPLQEDAYYSADYSGFYPEIILTVSLRPANNVNLCSSQAYGYLSAPATYQLIGRDQASRDFVSRLDYSRFDVYERETFLNNRVNLLARYFVNSRLCNFGCDF